MSLSNVKASTVCIKYGFGEGDWHGKRLISALTKSGFEVIREAERADIIISHSGGVFFLPKVNPNQLIVLIGPPYWPGKSLLLSFVQKVYRDIQDFRRQGKLSRWLIKTLWNCVYGVRYIIMTLTISWSARKHTFYKTLKQNHIVLIRNEEDAFCTPDVDLLPVPKGQFTYYHLPGQHDDVWEHPEPYIKVLQSVLDKPA